MEGGGDIRDEAMKKKTNWKLVGSIDRYDQKVIMLNVSVSMLTVTAFVF